MTNRPRFKRGVVHRVLNAEGSNARMAQQYWPASEQYRDDTRTPKRDQIAALSAHRTKLLGRLDRAMQKHDNTKAIKFINLIADASAKISLLMGQRPASEYRPKDAKQIIRDLG